MLKMSQQSPDNELLILLNKVLPRVQYTPTKEGIIALEKSIKRGEELSKCKCGSEDVYYNGKCFSCYYGNGK